MRRPGGGTLTVYGHDPAAQVALYRDPEACSFGQFGVDPAWSGRGIGRALHEHALEHARKLGARRMGLDTAAPAAALIATYERWGYRIVERHAWGTTNYESVIMAKELSEG